jgi:hypothetical protein
MREVVTAMIMGNPYIKPEDKPASADKIFKLSDDLKAEKLKPKPKQPTAEELEATRQELINLMNKK